MKTNSFDQVEFTKQNIFILIRAEQRLLRELQNVRDNIDSQMEFLDTIEEQQ